MPLTPSVVVEAGAMPAAPAPPAQRKGALRGRAAEQIRVLRDMVEVWGDDDRVLELHRELDSQGFQGLPEEA